MTKEKQIEEMAKYLYGMSIDTEADCQYVAEALYNEGYCKQIDGKWVKQVRIRKQGVPILHYYQCSLCGVYLVEQANYCPNCGAKMKNNN
jgi:rubrerythrin